MKTTLLTTGEIVTITEEIRNLGHGEQVKVIYNDGSAGWEHIEDLQLPPCANNSVSHHSL